MIGFFILETFTMTAADAADHLVDPWRNLSVWWDDPQFDTAEFDGTTPLEDIIVWLNDNANWIMTVRIEQDDDGFITLRYFAVLPDDNTATHFRLRFPAAMPVAFEGFT